MPEIKQPQDHKQKTVKPVVETVEVTLGSGDTERKVSAKRTVLRGITVTVLDEALDDFELLDDLRAVDVDKNASRLPALLRRLVGDGYQEIMEGLRDEDTGRVPIQSATGFIRDLMEALNPN